MTAALNDDVQLGTTLGSPTGTGLLFKGFGQGENSVAYKAADTVKPALLSMKRTLPKSLKDFPGVERGEVKLTRYYNAADGTLRVATIAIVSSIPSDAADAFRTALSTEAALIAGNSLTASLHATQTLPV